MESVAETRQVTQPTVTPPRGIAAAVFSLALGGFAIGTAEFAAMGILPQVAGDLSVSVPAAGSMISAYALGVVVGAPLLTVTCANVPRRVMLIALMLFYTVSNGATALLHSYHAIVISRFIAGLPHGAYFGLASLAAASLVPANRKGAAISKVALGLSVANVIGVPMAAWLGITFGWRACFAEVALTAAISAVMIRITVPGIPVSKKASPLTELGALRTPAVVITLLAGAVGFGGLFSVYSYVAGTLTHVTRVSEAYVPWALGVIGIGMLVGSAFIGNFADRWMKGTMLGMYGFTAVVLFLFSWLASYVVPMFVLLFCVGIGAAVTVCFQSRLMEVAGDAQSLAAALNHSAFNIANAFGAWIGGWSISMGLGWASTGWVGGVLSIAGILVLLPSFRPTSPIRS